MTELDLVPGKSRVTIRTFAEGLFARLAHDLELVCAAISGSGERGGTGSGSARLEIPLRSIEVSGILAKDGSVDRQGLSAGDRRDVLEKMRSDVFQANESASVKIEASVDGDLARVRLVPPNGRAVERTCKVSIADEEGQARVRGSIDLSLTAIGSRTVKGPMNAFRVKDSVEVHFDVVFAAR